MEIKTENDISYYDNEIIEELKQIATDTRYWIDMNWQPGDFYTYCLLEFFDRYNIDYENEEIWHRLVLNMRPYRKDIVNIYKKYIEGL